MEEKSIDDLISGDKEGADLDIAPDEASEKLSEKLAEITTGTKEDMAKGLAKRLGLPYINLVGFPIGPETIALIDQDTATSERLVVFYHSGKEMRLATEDPDNPKIDEIVKKLQRNYPQTNIALYLTSDHSMDEALKLYRTVPKIKEIPEGIKITQKDIDRFQKEIENFEQLDKRVSETKNMTDIMIMLLASAMKVNASDIHIEASEKEIQLRFRIDGILHRVGTIQKDVWDRLASRIKSVSGLIINVSDVPQDGRITIYLEDDKLEIRVSTLPSQFGESVVMRLLKSTATSLDFASLGIRGNAVEVLERQISRPNGMVLTTGPTGSGKTTTLYSILAKLNTPDKKIVTLEDPIEYKLPGITQSQIEVDQGYTFSSGLKSMLRQDPDIVMVGEIRDKETAITAANAALTGHLVISTVHTNDAAGAIPRLLALGLPPFQLAPAINAIMGQRLVRRLCEECKEEHEPEPKIIEKAKKVMDNLPDAEKGTYDLSKMTFYTSRGCDACNNLGFKGRIGIYEVLDMNREIEEVILSGVVSEYQMRDISKKAGMMTMTQDGIVKASEGITSLEEVFRVTE